MQTGVSNLDCDRLGSACTVLSRGHSDSCNIWQLDQEGCELAWFIYLVIAVGCWLNYQFLFQVSLPWHSAIQNGKKQNCRTHWHRDPGVSLCQRKNLIQGLDSMERRLAFFVGGTVKDSKQSNMCRWWEVKPYPTLLTSCTHFLTYPATYRLSKSGF